MKQKKQVITLGVLLVIAALVWYSQRSDTAPSSSGHVFDAEKYQIFSVENPQLRWWEIEKAQKTEYKSGGRNIFSKQAPVVVATNAKPAAVVEARKFVGPVYEPPPPP